MTGIIADHMYKTMAITHEAEAKMLASCNKEKEGLVPL